MNTRFAVAVHILAFLQMQAGEPATSELIASSVNTNASLIRRLLLQLSKAGLTTSQMGAAGGSLLARSADTITLLDIRRAVDEEGDVFAIHEAPNSRCPVGRNIQAVLENRIAEVEHVLDAALGRTTLADIAKDVTSQEKKRVRVRSG